jgi:hypothetical protein
MFENIIHEVVITPVAIEREGSRRYLIGFICAGLDDTHIAQSANAHR